jgi:hypothetical protein
MQRIFSFENFLTGCAVFGMEAVKTAGLEKCSLDWIVEGDCSQIINTKRNRSLFDSVWLSVIL